MVDVSDILTMIPQIMTVLVVVIVLGVPVGGWLVWNKRIKRDAYAIVLKMREGGLITVVYPARSIADSGNLKIIKTGDIVPIATVPVSFKKEFWERGAKPAWLFFSKEPGVYQPLQFAEPAKDAEGKPVINEKTKKREYVTISINTKEMVLTPLVNYAARMAWLTGQKEKERIYANRGLLEKYGVILATIIIVIMMAVLAWKLGDIATAMQSIKIPETITMLVSNGSQLPPPPI